MDPARCHIYRKARQDSERKPKLELYLHEYIERGRDQGDPTGRYSAPAIGTQARLKRSRSIASVRGRWCSGARGGRDRDTHLQSV